MIIINSNRRKIEKDKLAKIIAKLIPMLVHCNRYFRGSDKVVDLEYKITFK